RVNLLILGDLNPRKRVDLLIEAVAALDDPRLRIVHVGAWHGVQQFATELREKAKDLEARGQYVYGGKVSDTDLRRLYSSADLFVLPTLDEGFGFPPLEAMACGCNVLVSDIPPLRETMGDLATYAPLTAEGFTKGLEEALKRKRPAATLVDHAATFTWRRCAEQTLQAYAALAQ
ncbi:MAG TPA: glycosyltransferase, partial [Candidatus Thermoplasmatota archaeon]|nr:glycosyltransferase [Candidatus Thermoplasmatota archaeon]